MFFYQSVATPCLDDHLIHPQDVEEKRELSDVCAQIVLAGICRPDVLRSVNTSHGQSQSGNKACCKKTYEVDQLHSLNNRPFCHVGNKLKTANLAGFKMLLLQVICKTPSQR